MTGATRVQMYSPAHNHEDTILTQTAALFDDIDARSEPGFPHWVKVIIM